MAYRPTSLGHVCMQGKSMRLVAGNTGYGIYKNWPNEDILINVKSVPDLHRITTSKVPSWVVLVDTGPPPLLGKQHASLLNYVMWCCRMGWRRERPQPLSSSFMRSRVRMCPHGTGRLTTCFALAVRP